MRVVHIDTGREMRGGQWQVWYLHRGLLEAGVDSQLLCPASAPLFAKASSARLPVAPIPRLFWPAADLYHAHDARGHSLAAVHLRQPLLVSRRVAFPIRQGVASRWKYRQARRFLAISRHVERVMAAGGVDSERIRVVYDGVVLPDRMAAGGAIVAPATADSMKGSDLVSAAAQRAGLTVMFSDDLTRDLPQAGLFVYLSRSEGLGSAALLASAYGVPVLASAIDGLREAVDDQSTGVLVPNDVEAIAAAMSGLMKNDVKRRALGEAGRRRVAERFSVEQMVADTLQNYREVAG